MGRRFLVTGGAGFVGSHIVAALLARGDEVVVLDNLSTGHRGAVLHGARLVEADLADRAAVDAILGAGKWDAVFHFAALSLVGDSMREPLHYLATNIGHGLTLIDACIRHGVEKFVLSSTAALFGNAGAEPIDEDAPIDPGSPYGESKYALERALLWAGQIHGLRSAVLRYFNAAGADPEGRLGEDHRPESHLIPLVIDAALGRRGELAVFGTDYATRDGTCVRDYIHVSDLADAHLLALGRLDEGSVTYNLGNAAGDDGSGENAFLRFLRRAWLGEPELVCSPYFDPAWYAGHTPAFAGAKRSLGALHHFLTAPAGERGDPCAAFSTAYYLADVPEAGDGRFASPFEHFLKVGVFALRSPAEGIDLAGYVEGDPTAREDIAAGRVRDAFAHLRAHEPVAVEPEVVVAEAEVVAEPVAEPAGAIVPDVFGSHYFIGVDDAILCPPDGIVLIGWMLAPAGSFAEFTVVCGGRRVTLDPAGFVPTMRTDVIKQVGVEHGYHDPMCGFMAYAAGALEPGETPVLEIRRPNGEIVIRNIATPKLQGLAAIRALLDRFELRNAPMGRAFDAVIGPAMTALGRMHLAEPTTWEIQEFGAVEAAPEVSVIVPLYGRIGLMEYQLALMSAHGPGIAHELIYVLDDPAQRRAAEEMALSLFARFAVPFRLVMLSRNTGYAPANNIGLSVARGRQVCLLNSDVFPRDAGWLARLSARLDGAPELGAVGPLLLFEDGSVQHQGMSFAALPEFSGWWFPLHDRKGRRPLADGGVRTATAITGACMVIGRETLAGLGGLDPRYLIGDFEDSDLCLKLAAKGLTVAVDHGVAMYHLERQSQASAAQRWRMNLTLYNAWQHQRRWGGTISAGVAQ